VTIDPTAAGYGWFVDATPAADSEFLATPGSPAYGRMDLLTVVEHELGHVLGLQHSPIPGDVMDESLPTGVRRQPHAFEADPALAGFVPTSAGSFSTPAVAPIVATATTSQSDVHAHAFAAWDDVLIGDELIGGKLLR
jgi:hypothetical protein